MVHLVWRGVELGPPIFSPLHVRHLSTRSPEVLKFIGLPPGYRFLVAGEYVDVWYDASLLDA